MVLVKNPNGTDVFIEDLGITITSHDEIDLISWGVDAAEISASQDLNNLVQNGVLVINNGTNDLTISEALNHISIESIYQDNKNPDTVQGQLPAGGTTGQKLVKKSDDDYDTEWVDDVPAPTVSDIVETWEVYKHEEEQWEVALTFSFEGTDSIGAVPSAVSFYAKSYVEDGDFAELRLYDTTHNKIIALISTDDDLDMWIYYNDTSPTNWPAGLSTFEVQGRVEDDEDKIKSIKLIISF